MYIYIRVHVLKIFIYFFLYCFPWFSLTHYENTSAEAIRPSCLFLYLVPVWFLRCFFFFQLFLFHESKCLIDMLKGSEVVFVTLFKFLQL